MSHSNLIRGLLLSTLVWTLPVNYDQEVLAQVENKQTLTITENKTYQKRYRELLRQATNLQEQSINHRELIYKANLNSQEKNQNSYKPVLTSSKNFAQSLNKFVQEIEKNSELYSFPEISPILKNIAQDLILLKDLRSNLETTDENNLDKVTLESIQKVRDLELHTYQIENIIYRQLLDIQQANKLIASVLETSTEQQIIQTLDTKVANNTTFFNFKALIVLTLLSSCAIVIVLVAHKQNKYFRKIKIQSAQDDQWIPPQPENNHDNYRNSINQDEQEISGIASYGNGNINHHPKNKQFHPNQHQNKKIKPSFNAHNTLTSNLLSKKEIAKPLPQSISPVQYITTEEALVTAYRKNPKLLAKKVIKVAATRESIEQIRAGIKTTIVFTETTNDSYWIALEPELEGNHYFLLPKPNLIINSRIYQTIEDIFSCPGYETRSSNRFKLNLPAVVQFNGSGCWKLVEPGELSFS